MIDHLIEQLNDSNKDTRKQAIIALGRSKDMAALPYLANVFRDDPEPELRELARKAGAYIRQQNGETSAAAPASSASAPPSYAAPAVSSLNEDGTVKLRVYKTPTPKEEARKPETEIPTRGREYTVTKQNRDRAKSLVEFALSSNINGDNAQAMKYLAQALRLNPNLINDDYYASVAGSVTGESGDEAIRMIVDSETRKGFVKSAVAQKKEQIKSEHLEKAKQDTWRGASFEYVLFLIINILFPLLSSIVIIEVTRSVFDIALAQMESGELGDAAAFAPIALQYELLFSSIGFWALFVSSLATGINNIIFASLHAVVNHYIAKAFGGVGTFSHLIASLFAYYNRWIPILFVVSTLWVVTILVTYGSVVFVGLGGLVVFYVSFRAVSRVSRVVAECYNLNFLMGCVSYLLSNVILTLIFFAIAFLLSSLLTAVVVNMFPPEVMQTLTAPTLMP